MTTREAFGAYRALKRWVEATGIDNEAVSEAMTFFWWQLSDAERDMLTSEEIKRIADREKGKAG